MYSAQGFKLNTLSLLLGEIPLAMGKSNHTVTAFILVGFTTDAVVQLVPFVAVLGVYCMIVPGNTTLIVLIGNDS